MPVSIETNGVPRHPQVLDQGDRRLVWLDASRTLALLAMIVFHFVRDLELFGVVASGTTSHGAWAVFARLIAGTFIFLSGISFVVAHRTGFRPVAWRKRFFMISAAAALVSLATYAAFPERFIYFGILHCLAAASLVGVLGLLAPAWVLLACAVLILFVDRFFGAGVYSSPWLAWSGLAATVRPSLDFLPLVPWLSAFLLGMALARLSPFTGFDLPIGSRQIVRVLVWPGRHSLAVYLLHQPVLFGIIWLGLLVSRATMSG